MTTIVFSNGNTLNICSLSSGPCSKSARMPSEFVIANSASTPCWSSIERATRLPSCESPPDESLRAIVPATFVPSVLPAVVAETYANTPFRSMSWLIFTE